MDNSLIFKVELLKKQLTQLESVVIGLSGGVDSSLLAKVSHNVLGDKAIAVTLVSPMIPQWDLEDAKLICTQLGMEHVLIEDNSIDSIIAKNTVDRCYHCKKAEFGAIIKLAANRGFNAVLDGSNVDDANDYRPGAKSMQELNVISPLKMAGFTKSEIRIFSKSLGLHTWDKPAYACLASRIPYGNEITLSKLSAVEKAEIYLHSIGFKGSRVRHHGDIARIELSPNDRVRFSNIQTMESVSKKLKEYGFLYVCMELEGYKMGSLNTSIS
jgi:uncharacterized protein